MASDCLSNMAEIPPTGSNYYRPPTERFGGGPTPPGPAAVTFESIGTAWKMVSADWGLWIPAALLSLVIMTAIYLPPYIAMQFMIFSTLSPGSSEEITLEQLAYIYGIMIPAAVLVTAVAYMTVGAMMNMAYLKLAGQPVSVVDLFTSMRRFFPLLGTSILMSLAVTIGSFFCAVPGLVAMGIFAFAPILVIRENMGAFEALKGSVGLLKKDWLLMTALTLVVSLLASLGSCACLVGLIFTWSLYPVTLGINYYNFRPPAQPEQPAPASLWSAFPERPGSAG